MTTKNQLLPGQETDNGEALFQRLGQVTRMLRESLRELGLQKEIERAAEAVPDARARLGYVASMTEQAADKVLNAVDRAQPMQDRIDEGAQHLQARWEEWMQASGDVEAARALALHTTDYLAETRINTRATSKELLDITMAQDFQDLTGQVIKKLMELMQNVEDQLLNILLDSRPGDKKREQSEGEKVRDDGSLLNGPQINPNAQNVMSSQDQVDDLLDELGF